MDRLRTYIEDNRSEFDSAPLPPGSKERFMAKTRKRRTVRLSFAAIPAAAAAGIAAVIMTLQADERHNVSRMIERMTDCEVEIMAMVENAYPDEIESVSNTVRAITFEAIPLASLLPDELSQYERVRILEEYYGQKIEALERVKSYYANIDEL